MWGRRNMPCTDVKVHITMYAPCTSHSWESSQPHEPPQVPHSLALMTVWVDPQGPKSQAFAKNRRPEKCCHFENDVNAMPVSTGIWR